MKPKKTIYIQDDKLKSYEQDTFGHVHIANAIVDSIVNTNPPFTIGVFGGWGTGKSSLLEMIDAKLRENSIFTVTIDAWRYSSAENLRRAFLVHVAQKISKKVVADLRRELFSSVQTTEKDRKSIFSDQQTPFFKQVIQALVSFFEFALIFIGFLFLLFQAKNAFINHSCFLNIRGFNWAVFFSKIIDLAYIPFIVTILNELRFYFVQNPVTVHHERIDADELFAEYFDRVVNSKIKKGEKLCIFVDNLDRLTDNKMVEALESLKTYISNEKCIFVVACDEAVVRSILNRSEDIPKIIDENGNEDTRAGEHYLDKFFQQTFRVPEYLGMDLQDFAESNFKFTILSDALFKKGIDIRNLISIILPSDIKSPRKVKRLLNEFIAYYEIVRRKENKNNGQLSPGTLSDNIEFLGKFSTLRSEFPFFYNLLLNDPELLKKINSDLSTGTTEEALEKFKKYILNSDRTKSKTELSNTMLKEYSSLIAYLNKTKTIITDDIEAYIWLSQDPLSLDLGRDKYDSIRDSLANDNLTQFKEILDSSEKADSKKKIVVVASRLVEQKLKGIEKLNGVIVLSRMLPEIEQQLRPEIANVISKALSINELSKLSENDLFNTIRWATSRGIKSQKEIIVKNILSRLNLEETRLSTFESILDNADILDKEGKTKQIRKWLEEILDIKAQSINEVIDPENQTKKDLNHANREFGDLLIGKAINYREMDFVLGKYLIPLLIPYMINRLLGVFNGIPKLTLEPDEFGLNPALTTLFSKINEVDVEHEVWLSTFKIIMDPTDIYTYRFFLVIIDEIRYAIPNEYSEELFSSILTGFQKISNLFNDEYPTHLIDSIKNISYYLLERKDIDLKEENLTLGIQSIQEFLNSPKYRETFLDLLNKVVHDLGWEKKYIFINPIIEAFKSLASTLDSEHPLLNSICDLSEFSTEEQQAGILIIIDTLIASNDQKQIDLAAKYLDKLSSIKKYESKIPEKIKKLSIFSKEDNILLLQAKMKLFTNLLMKRLLEIDVLIDKLIPSITFDGDQEKINLVLFEFTKYVDKISNEAGHKLYKAVVDNFDQFGDQKNKMFLFVFRWNLYAEQPEQEKFDIELDQMTATHPKEVLQILTNNKYKLSSDQLKRHILSLYSITLGESDLITQRRDFIRNQIGKIRKSDQRKYIEEFWKMIEDNKSDRNSFLTDILPIFPIEDIYRIRNIAIEIIRKNEILTEVEKQFDYLKLFIREDMREIMPTVDLIVELFSGDTTDINLALKYAVGCLKPLRIRDDHKYKLSQAMYVAVDKTEDENTLNLLQDIGNQLLDWFDVKKHKKEAKKRNKDNPQSTNT